MAPPRSRLLSALEGAAAVLLLALMALVLVDVTLRSAINRPLAWGTEVMEVMLGVMIFLLYPVLAAGGGHITVDLIPVRPVLARVQRVLADLAGASLFGIVAGCLARQASRAAEYGDGTSLLKIPFSWILGGMAGLALVAAVAFVGAGWQALRAVERR